MIKKKLLLVVGAGASVDFGMPSVSCAGKIISAELQPFYRLAHQQDTNLYEHIERMVKEHWNQNFPSNFLRAPQFEDVLSAIFGLASAYPAGVFTSPLGALITARELPRIITYGGKVQDVIKHDVSILGAQAVDALLRDILERCKVCERTKQAEFARLQSLVTALQTRFDIAVVTLNYDDILYRVFPDIETGFDPNTKCFRDQRIFERKAWPCMLHLHGSVHFNMPDSRSHDLHEIFWEPDLDAAVAQNAFGRNSQYTPEGAEFPTSVIIAGYAKPTQLLRRPFRTYYSEFDRLVWACDAVLFAGYGFGDKHINAAFDQFRDDRRRPVAIIDLAKKGSPMLGWPELASNDRLASTVVHTFHNNLGCFFGDAAGLPPLVDRLLELRKFAFNKDYDNPLGIWYGGLLEACDNAEKVLAILDNVQQCS
jgi:hypothetical protein